MFVTVTIGHAATAVGGGTKVPAFKDDNKAPIVTAPPAAAANFRKLRLSMRQFRLNRQRRLWCGGLLESCWDSGF